MAGPNLTDAEWIHSKGTLEEIEAPIDIKACAAYVHSMSQKSGS